MAFLWFLPVNLIKKNRMFGSLISGLEILLSILYWTDIVFKSDKKSFFSGYEGKSSIEIKGFIQLPPINFGAASYVQQKEPKLKNTGTPVDNANTWKNACFGYPSDWVIFLVWGEKVREILPTLASTFDLLPTVIEFM